ncbi:MAG: EAL domain-containing protein [Nitrospinota bacterium]
MLSEFIAHYQPIVDLKKGQIVAMEALMRWQPPDGTLTSPANFIPLAEETGLIVKLDEWMLQNACAFAQK